MALGPEGFWKRKGRKEGAEGKEKIVNLGEKHYIPHTFLVSFFAQSYAKKYTDLRFLRAVPPPACVISAVKGERDA